MVKILHFYHGFVLGFSASSYTAEEALGLDRAFVVCSELVAIHPSIL